MPETKSEAIARAKEEGISILNVVESDDGGHFIAPPGIKSEAAKKAYANCRADGGNREKCAKIAWDIEKN